MIYIGTSGFSYEDWIGYFYPEGVSRRDMLPYYAARFNAVEINSSYYAIPGASSFAAMAAKTPDSFRFAVKAHRDMTHEADGDPEVFTRFVNSIRPLEESGKLGCVLAQFPWGFKPCEESIRRLKDFRERVGDLPTVVEFRNAEWVSEDTFGLLRELDFGFCAVDEPRLKGLMPPVAVRTSSIAYVRFHGRNAARWWKHDAPHERYDYLYSEEELAEWVPKVRQLAGEAEDTYVFFNNHFRGKSAQNARTFSAMLGLPLRIQEQDPVLQQPRLDGLD